MDALLWRQRPPFICMQVTLGKEELSECTRKLNQHYNRTQRHPFHSITSNSAQTCTSPYTFIAIPVEFQTWRLALLKSGRNSQRSAICLLMFDFPVAATKQRPHTCTCINSSNRPGNFKISSLKSFLLALPAPFPHILKGLQTRVGMLHCCCVSVYILGLIMCSLLNL